MRRHPQLGFTLLELAVVLTIIGIVVSSSAIINSQQVTREETRKTQNELQAISNAIKIFARIHGRLPCPAILNAAATDITNYGREATDCSDSSPPAGLTRVQYPAGTGHYIRIGGVPTKALGLANDFADDEWRGRYIYAVDEPMISAISEDVDGTIEIRDGNNTIINSQGAYALISTGKTQKGGILNSTLATVDACDATNKDGENCDNDGIFVDQHYNNGNVAANFYDDTILWKTRRNILQQDPTSETNTGTSGGSSSSSSGASSCDVYVNYDMDSAADEYAWRITDPSGPPTYYADQWTSADNNSTGIKGPYSLTVGTDYRFWFYNIIGNSSSLDTAGDFVRLRASDATTGQLLAEKTGTTSFVSCTRDFQLDSSCLPVAAGNNMTCTAAPTCDVNVKWAFGTSAGQHYNWTLTQGASTLDGGTVASGDSGAKIVSGLSPATSYTYTITDTEADGITGMPLGSEAMGIEYVSTGGGDIGFVDNTAGVSPFTTCTKTFTLGGDCTYTGATSMSCTGPTSCNVAVIWQTGVATDSPDYTLTLAQGATTVYSKTLNTKEGANAVVAINADTPYTFTITDTVGDGLTASDELSVAALPTRDYAALKRDTSAFSSCTKSFELDSSCLPKDADTSMSCTGSSSSSSSGGTPPAPDDLVLWLDATDMDASGDSTGEYSDGADVERWIDKSANRYQLDRTDSSLPRYQASVSKFGNLPSVYFDGRYSHLYHENDGMYNYDPVNHAFTIASVYGVDTTTGEDFAPIVANSDTDSPGSANCYGLAASRTWANYANSPTGATITTSDPIAAVTVFDGLKASEGTVNTSDTSIPANSMAGQSDTGRSNIMLGMNPTQSCQLGRGGYALEGNISEVLLYNRALTPTEVCELKTYFDDKWGTSSANGCAGSSSSSSSGGATSCDLYVKYDMDSDADDFAWKIVNDDRSTTLYSGTWTSAQNNATGNSGPYSLAVGRPYYFQFMEYVTATGVSLDTVSDYVRLMSNDPSTGTVLAEKTGTGSFVLCEKEITLDSSCNPSTADTTMTCTGVPSCSATVSWNTTGATDSPNYTWKVLENTTVLDTGTVNTATSGTHTVTGLVPGTTYTMRVDDANADGFIGPVAQSIALSDTPGPSAIARLGTGDMAFAFCLKTFSLDSSCARTDTDPTMICLGTPTVNPPSSGDLILWLDSTDVNGDGVTASGEPANGTFLNAIAGGWQDKTTGSYDFASIPCVSAPRYMTGIANSKPAFYFNGSACVENTTFPMKLPDIHAYTVATAALPSSAVGLNQIPIINSERTAGSGACWGISGNNVHANTSVSASAPEPGSVATVTTSVNAFSGTGTSSGKFHTTNTSLGSITGVVTAGGWTTRLGRAVAASGDCNFGTTALTGYISEILVYGRALSASERCDVQCYLKGKWTGTPSVAGCATSTYCP